MNIGRSAAFKSSTAAATRFGSPPGRGSAAMPTFAAVGGGASSAKFIKRSSGISRNTGPGRFERASRNAASRYSPMRSVDGTDTLHFVIERMSSTWFMSWSEPMSASARGPAPPITIIGTAARCAFATAVTVSVTPGPAVTAHTPTVPVMRDHASAAWPAVCSWRTSTTRMPSSKQPS